MVALAGMVLVRRQSYGALHHGYILGKLEQEDGHCSGKLALINLTYFVGNGCKNLKFFFTYLMLEDLKYILTAVTSDMTNRNAHLHIELAYPC